MGSLIGLLINATGWKESICRAIAYVGLILTILGLIGGVVAFIEHRGVSKYVAKQEERARPATQQADQQRGKDTADQARQEQETHDAIHAQPDQPIAPSSRAHACLQLRRAGQHSAACG